MEQTSSFGRRGAVAAPAAVTYRPPARTPAPASPPQAERSSSMLWGIARLMFGFEGRLARWDYRIVRLIWYPFVLITAFGLGAALKSAHGELPTLLALALGSVAFWLIVLWTNIALQVKRWHDLDRGWPWIFVGFIPIAGPIWVAVACAWMEGEPGVNRFGATAAGSFAGAFD